MIDTKITIHTFPVILLICLMFRFSCRNNNKIKHNAISLSTEQIQNLITENLSYIQILDISKPQNFMLTPNRIKYNKINNCLYIWDYDAKIVVTDIDFNVKFEIGNEGQGPIEFSKFTYLNFIDDMLYTVDYAALRIQLLTLKGGFIESFKIKYGYDNFIATNNQFDTFYMTAYNTPDEKLFGLMNKRGDITGRFGDYINIHIEFELNRVSNSLYMTVDTESDLFCVFQHIPILRKYNTHGRIVYECNFEELEEVADAIAHYENIFIPEMLKKLSGNKEREKWIRTHKNICKGIYVDSNFVYILFRKRHVVVFDKTTGQVIKRIILHGTDSRHDIQAIDVSSDKFIFAVEHETCNLLKYLKY
ncbi:hypothetical protein KAR48_12875 [bacterium]|nr:hypothetical protein [bacterium]